MATTRKPISKKIRFEVFKRDSFKCQFCGKAAPEIILHVDHIDPLSKGGSNDIMNLITACENCNQGKGARKLDDNSVVLKSKKQADAANERRLQLEMMMQWRNELHELDSKQLDMVCDYWSSLAHGYSANEHGRQIIMKHIKRYGIENVLDAIQTATTQYLRYGKDENITKESVEEAFNKIGGILRIEKASKNKPYLKELYYTRGILRKREFYVDERNIITMLEDAVNAGVDVEEMKHVAKIARNWTDFKRTIEDLASKTPSKEELPQQPLDTETIIHGEKVDLGMDLSEKYGLADDAINEIIDALGPLCGEFNQYRKQRSETPTDIYWELSFFLKSDEFQSLSPVKGKWNFQLEKLNTLLFNHMETDIPFVYFENIKIKVITFSRRRNYLQFKEVLNNSGLTCEGKPYFLFIQQEQSSVANVKSFIHLGMKGMMIEEFERLGISLNAEKVMHLLKYYSYDDILYILSSWTTTYDEEGNGKQIAPEELTWSNFLCELSVNLVPDYDCIIREGNTDGIMEIYKDCNSFGQGYYFKHGLLRESPTNNWNDYIEFIKKEIGE